MRKSSMYDVLGAFAERASEVERTIMPGSLRHNVYRRVIDSISPQKVSDAQRAFQGRLIQFNSEDPAIDKAGPEKYFDIPLFLADRIRSALSLNLVNASPKKILDIGSGPGHFGAVCNALGHEVLGIDVSHELYSRLCDVMGVKTRVCPVRRRKKLPDLGNKFDLVTAIWVCFDVLGVDDAGKQTYWSIEDWKFFVEDLFSNQVTDDGAVYLSLNLHAATKGGKEYNSELLGWCKKNGAATNTETGTIYWERKEYIRRHSRLVQEAGAAHGSTSDLQTLFFTYANARYEHYVLPYIYSVLFHNSDAAVEVCLDSTDSFLERNRTGLEVLERCFGAGRIRLRDTIFAKAKVVRPQSVRNVETPTLMLPYTYIGDIDILILEGGITAKHKANMERIGLPYSNTYRRVEEGGRDLLSGLHFTRTDAYYPQIDVSDLDLKQIGNQDLIYKLAVGKVGKAPPKTAKYRPWHGFHVSERLNFYMRDPAGRQYGLNDVKMCEAYRRMRSTSGWRQLYSSFSPEYKAIVDLIDSALQRLYPEWPIINSPDLNATSLAIEVIPGPLRVYPYQAYINGLKELIANAKIKSVVDLGCGDPLATLLAVGATDLYVGLDTDRRRIDCNLETYRHPKHLFKLADITLNDPPAADLILSRDTLNGLSLDDISLVLERVGRSGAKYLAITHYPEHSGKPIVLDGYQIINWKDAPFSLGEPDFVFKDTMGEFIPDFIGGESAKSPSPAPWAMRIDRHIAVWELRKLRAGERTQTSVTKKSVKNCVVLKGPFQKVGNVGWYGVLSPDLLLLADDEENPKQSTVLLLEDGVPLGPAHALHDIIRNKGLGSFSHWGKSVYFSTIDNSDPNTNGRQYTITFHD